MVAGVEPPALLQLIQAFWA